MKNKFYIIGLSDLTDKNGIIGVCDSLKKAIDIVIKYHKTYYTFDLNSNVKAHDVQYTIIGYKGNSMFHVKSPAVVYRDVFISRTNYNTFKSLSGKSLFRSTGERYGEIEYEP